MWFVAVLLAATSPSASTAPRDVARTATAALDPSPLVGPEWLAPLVRAGAPDVRASETDVDVAIAAA
jgi:hypothetical protein